MLVIAREIDQSIIIGDADTVQFQMTAADFDALKHFCPPEMACLAAKLELAFKKRAPIEIVIVDIRGAKKVRVGTIAPKHVDVHRKELYEQLEIERKAAGICVGHCNPTLASSQAGR